MCDQVIKDITTAPSLLSQMVQSGEADCYAGGHSSSYWRGPRDDMRLLPTANLQMPASLATILHEAQEKPWSRTAQLRHSWSPDHSLCASGCLLL